MSHRQRRALVIGGLGFIGGNLVRALVDRGDAITVVTPSRERHRDQATAFETRGVRSVEGDVRNRELMSQLVADQDVVYNLSGQSGGVRSMEEPLADLDVNCSGNLSLLEAVRAVKPAPKVIFVGTRLHYGRTDGAPVAEDHPSEPTCLHAIHKATVEQYLHLYGRLFGLRYAIARVTNPFGAGQPAGRTAYGVVNRLIELALRDQPLTIYGDGRQLRDYVHVDDVVGALITLAESDASDGRVYNVGSGVGTRMIDMARLIVEIASGGRIEHVAWPVLAEQIETGDFVADISRIRRELGWTPTIPLREGLERTVAACHQHVRS